MRKGNSFTFLLIIAVVMGIVVFLSFTRPRNTVEANNTKELDEAMAMDFESEYPGSPNAVLEAYNKIERLFSGNLKEEITDEELKTLIEKQRTLLDKELLGINPVETQIQGVKDKIQYCADEAMRIIQIKVETPVFSQDAQRCSINAHQYWSIQNKYNGTSDVVYHMLKEEDSGEYQGRWHIVGWEVTDIRSIGGTENEDGE